MLRTVIGIFLFSTANPALAEVRVVQNAKGDVTALSGLAEDPVGCTPFKINGLLVKRDFDKDAITLLGITVEESSGARSFLNVTPPPKELSGGSLANFVSGMQLLTRVGRKVSISGYACGAAGRTLDLDAIK